MYRWITTEQVNKELRDKAKELVTNSLNSLKKKNCRLLHAEWSGYTLHIFDKADFIRSSVIINDRGTVTFTANDYPYKPYEYLDDFTRIPVLGRELVNKMKVEEKNIFAPYLDLTFSVAYAHYLNDRFLTYKKTIMQELAATGSILPGIKLNTFITSIYGPGHIKVVTEVLYPATAPMLEFLEEEYLNPEVLGKKEEASPGKWRFPADFKEAQAKKRIQLETRKGNQYYALRTQEIYPLIDQFSEKIENQIKKDVLIEASKMYTAMLTWHDKSLAVSTDKTIGVVTVGSHLVLFKKENKLVINSAGNRYSYICPFTGLFCSKFIPEGSAITAYPEYVSHVNIATKGEKEANV